MSIVSTPKVSVSVKNVLETRTPSVRQPVRLSRGIDTDDLVAAFSLSRLITDYTDSLIKVERLSDNARLDIGYSGIGLNISAAENFCSGTDGFMESWYDQSGNSNDLSRPVIENTAQVVSDGSIITGDHGLPVCDFLDRITFYSEVGPTITQPFTMFFVLKPLTSGNEPMFDGYDALGAFAELNTTYKINMYAGQTLSSSNDVVSSAKDWLVTMLFNGASSEMWVDTVSVASGNVGTDSLDFIAFALGGGAEPVSFNGDISEFLLYDANKSTQREAIEANINDYYSIY